MGADDDSTGQKRCPYIPGKTSRGPLLLSIFFFFFSIRFVILFNTENY